VHGHLGARALASEVRREGGKTLDFVQRASRGVIGENEHGTAHFVDHIGPATVWMKRQVARTGAGFHQNKRRIICLQHGPAGIKAVAEHLVQAQIADQRMAAGCIRPNPVRIGVVWRCGFTLDPECWINVATSPNRPSGPMGSVETQPPL